MKAKQAVYTLYSIIVIYFFILPEPTYALNIKLLLIAMRNDDFELFVQILEEALTEDGLPSEAAKRTIRYKPYIKLRSSRKLSTSTQDQLNQIIPSYYIHGPWGDVTSLTPLQIASKYCTSNFVNTLINCGADVNLSPWRSFDFDDDTCCRPVYLAVASGHLENLEVLIQRGAEYGFSIDHCYRNLMHVAIKNNYINIARFFLLQSPEMLYQWSLINKSPLHLSVRLDRLSAFVMFINCGVDISTIPHKNLLSLAHQSHSNNVFNLLGVAIIASGDICSSDYHELNEQAFPLRFWAILVIAKNFQLEPLKKILPKKISLFLFGKPEAD